MEPRSFAQAIKSDVWKPSMNEEFVALEDKGTWSLTSLPPGKHAIGCKWVYKLKYNADGTLDRRKSRLVAKGYTQ